MAPPRCAKRGREIPGPYASWRFIPFLCEFRLLVQWLQVCNYLLGIARVNLKEPAGASPVASYNHHLHVGSFSKLCFNHRCWFILRAGANLVFTRFSVDGKPTTVSEAIDFFIIDKYGRLQSGPREMMLSEEDDGRIFTFICVKRRRSW